MSAAPRIKSRMGVYSALVLVVGIGLGIGWVLTHGEATAPARPESDTGTASDSVQPPQQDPSSEVEDGDTPVSSPADSADEITAAESWNFPEPDVVLQFEWYHLDKNCSRLVPDPAPTPMLRDVAIRAGFKPCFVCARGDEERPLQDTQSIPGLFQGDPMLPPSAGTGQGPSPGAAQPEPAPAP